MWWVFRCLVKLVVCLIREKKAVLSVELEVENGMKRIESKSFLRVAWSAIWILQLLFIMHASENSTYSLIAQEPENSSTPPILGIPDSAIKRWEQAGGFINWMSLDEDGDILFGYERREPSHGWPRYVMSQWNAELFAQLEIPETGIAVDFGLSKVTDAQLETIAKIKHMRALSLFGTGISDRGLKHLRGLDELEWIDLDCVQISDAGIDFVSSNPNLSAISLFATTVSDKAVAKLAKLEKLEHLRLSGCIFLTDRAIKSLADRRKLRTLCLSHTEVTGKKLMHLTRITSLERLGLRDTSLQGLDGIQKLENLRALDLSHTKITDKDLLQLSNLMNLKSLNLGSCQVTDVGLKALSVLPELQALRLEQTKITNAGLAELGKLNSLQVLTIPWPGTHR